MMEKSLVEKLTKHQERFLDIITPKIEPNPQDEITSELRFADGKTIIALEINKGSRNVCQKIWFSSMGCTMNRYIL